MLHSWEAIGQIAVLLAIVLFAAYFCKNQLGWSFSELFKVLTGEFERLAAREWSRESINAIGVISSILLLLAYFFLSTVRGAFKLAIELNPEGVVAAQIFAGFFCIAMFTLLCVSSCPKK